MPRTKREGDRYEDDLHVRGEVYLHWVLPTGCFRCHVPNQSRGSGQAATASDLRGIKIMAAKLKSMGVRPGMPDMLLWWQGQTFAWDYKSVYGKATDEQIAVAAEMVAAGCRMLDPVSHPVRTIEDLEQALVGWGIPLKFSYITLKNKNTMTAREYEFVAAVGSADKALKARRAIRSRRKASAIFSQGAAGKKILASS